jgi:hypothetical protein
LVGVGAGERVGERVGAEWVGCARVVAALFVCAPAAWGDDVWSPHATTVMATAAATAASDKRLFTSRPAPL